MRTFWHRAIHIGQGVSTGWAKNSKFWPFLAFTSPISQRPLKIEAYKQRMKFFDPPCRNTEICPPWKSCLECEWRVCVSSTDALVYIPLPPDQHHLSDVAKCSMYWRGEKCLDLDMRDFSLIYVTNKQKANICNSFQVIVQTYVHRSTKRITTSWRLNDNLVECEN